MQNIPVGQASDVVDEMAFLAAFHKPGHFARLEGRALLWRFFGGGDAEWPQDLSQRGEPGSRDALGQLTIGCRRAKPDASCFPATPTAPLSQPNTPTVKTSIYHAGGERDEYFGARVYGFGSVSFDHNFSQDLELQQTYGGGVGWTVIKASEADAGPQGQRQLRTARFYHGWSRRRPLQLHFYRGLRSDVCPRHRAQGRGFRQPRVDRGTRLFRIRQRGNRAPRV